MNVFASWTLLFIHNLCALDVTKRKLNIFNFGIFRRCVQCTVYSLRVIHIMIRAPWRKIGKKKSGNDQNGIIVHTLEANNNIRINTWILIINAFWYDYSWFATHFPSFLMVDFPVFIAMIITCCSFFSHWRNDSVCCSQFILGKNCDIASAP